MATDKEGDLMGCAEGSCDDAVHARGYCAQHYQRRLRSGILARLEPKQRQPKMVCRLCGRFLLNHGISEWCQIESRYQ